MRPPLASVFQAILLSVPLSLACSASEESPTGSTSASASGQGGAATAGTGGAGGTAPAGQGGTTAGGQAGSALDGFQQLACLQPGLAAELQLDSLEVLSAKFSSLPPEGMQGSWESMYLDGSPCAGSSSNAACLADLDAKKKGTTVSQLRSQGAVAGNIPFSQREIVVSTSGESVTVLSSLDQLRSLITPLDSLARLALWMRYDHPNGCAYQVREIEGGYEVWVLHILVSDCPLSYKRALYRVDPDGQTTLLKEEPEAGGGGGCAGRRPEGLWPEVSPDEGGPLGAFFARMAYLEAASIEAFARLHDELARHGAPVELSQECLVSAADEVRHASAMGELAARFGATPAEVRLSPPRARSLLELALENAVEGCVRETYGALEASYQASHADDPEVRATMGRIARDETAHATFSWNLHTWLEDRLSEREWQQVEQAMHEASIALRGELSRPRELSLVTVAGLPDEDTAQALLEGLEERLWGETPRLVA